MSRKLALTLEGRSVVVQAVCALIIAAGSVANNVESAWGDEAEGKIDVERAERELSAADAKVREDCTRRIIDMGRTGLEVAEALRRSENIEVRLRAQAIIAELQKRMLRFDGIYVTEVFERGRRAYCFTSDGHVMVISVWWGESDKLPEWSANVQRLAQRLAKKVPVKSRDGHVDFEEQNDNGGLVTYSCDLTEKGLVVEERLGLRQWRRECQFVRIDSDKDKPLSTSGPRPEKK